MSRLGLALLLAGCGGPVDSAGETPGSGSATGGSGTAGSGSPSLVCTQRAGNVLLWDCEASLASDQPAQAFLEEPDGSLRALQAEQEGASLRVTAWRLLARTAYRVRVQPASGPELSAAFTTAALPEHVVLDPVVSGSATFEALLLPQQCDGPPLMLLVDPQGRVLWYLEVAEGLPGDVLTAVDGFDASDAGVIAVVGRSRLREWTWTQELRLDLGWPEDLPHPVHHDVVWRPDQRFVLTARSYTGADGLDYVMDGVLVLDPDGGLVADWDLSWVVEPTGGGAGGGFWGSIFPGHTDFAHVNGFDVEPDGAWRISSRRQDTVIRVRGDWTAPDFGQLDWAVSSAADGAFGNDFQFQGSIQPPDFQDQHHPNLDATGRMLLFDNRELLSDPSRATIWAVDEGAGTITLEHAWSLGEHCAVQGSVFPVGSDHVVATCATSQVVREFAVGQPDPVWTLEPRCASGLVPALVVRAMPMAF